MRAMANAWAPTALPSLGIPFTTLWELWCRILWQGEKPVDLSVRSQPVPAEMVLAEWSA